MNSNALFALATPFVMALALTSTAPGCNKKSTDSDSVATPAPTVAAEPTSPSAGTCTQVGAKVRTMMAASSPSAGLPADAQAKLTAVFAKAETKVVDRCMTDKWPADFLDCVDQAADAQALDLCKLPAHLEKNIMEDMQSLVPEMLEAVSGAAPNASPEASE